MVNVPIFCRRFADGFLSDGENALLRAENVVQGDEDLLDYRKDLFKTDMVADCKADWLPCGRQSCATRAVPLLRRPPA